MKKVYIVISGCVDDRFPVNVFRTKELADGWISENKKKLYDPEVDEWDVYNKIKGIEPYQGEKI